MKYIFYCYDGFPEQNATAIVACEDGSLSEIPLPERASSNIGASFSLSVEKRSLLFKSIKSELLRADEQREIDRKKQEKLDRKIVELEKVKMDNPNLDIDESLFLSEFKAIQNVYISTLSYDEFLRIRTPPKCYMRAIYTNNVIAVSLFVSKT